MKASPNRFVSANLPVNKFKNRLVNILPCKYKSETLLIRAFILFIFNTWVHSTNKQLSISVESTRVALQPIRGVDGSDYINASFIDVSFHNIKKPC